MKYWQSVGLSGHWCRQLWGTCPPSTYYTLIFSLHFDLYKIWQRLYVDSFLLRSVDVMGRIVPKWLSVGQISSSLDVYLTEEIVCWCCPVLCTKFVYNNKHIFYATSLWKSGNIRLCQLWGIKCGGKSGVIWRLWNIVRVLLVANCLACCWKSDMTDLLEQWHDLDKILFVLFVWVVKFFRSTRST